MDYTTQQQIRRQLADSVAAGNHWADRFVHQIDFVDQFAELHPGRAKKWAPLIARAWELVRSALAGGKLEGLEPAVRAAEEVLAPVGELAKTYTIHCVGHAHIDMNWLWSWPETVAVTNDTFTTVLKLMEEFPDFCFTQSQASVYQIVRRHNGPMLAQIRRRVAQGRWEVAVAQWVEGDKNIVSGESLARHLLYARRLMKELFGLSGEQLPLDWSPDTFGHAVSVPTIVSRGAVRRYYMCRGGKFQKPPVFWWQGPDGSRVLVNLETTWYNDQIGPHNVKPMVQFCRKTGLKDWMCVYGVGDHGGGPTRRDIRRGLDMNGWPIYPTFRFATTKPFYDILEAAGDRWPVLDCELNFEFTGCYSSQSRIKKANRHGENLCVEAESAATLAYRAMGRPYPGAEIRQAWIDTLFGHFHDILPGSGVRATREYQLGLFQQTAAATGSIKTNCYRALAGRIDTSLGGTSAGPAAPAELESLAMGAGVGRGSGNGAVSQAAHVADGPRGVVLFNPIAGDRREVVKAVVWDGDSGPAIGELKTRRFVVSTGDGQVLPAQNLGGGDYWGHRFVELAFPAEVKSLGYSACVIEDAAAAGTDGMAVSPADPPRPAVQFTADLAMENEHLAVEIDRQTGGIVKLVDKKTGVNLAGADRPLGVLEYILERPHDMTAWVIGDTSARVSPLPLESLKRTRSGPYVASVEAKAHLNDSEIHVEYALKAGQSVLEITVRLVWLERGGTSQDQFLPSNSVRLEAMQWQRPKLPAPGVPMLRMEFPLALEQAAGRYEIPYGSIQRPPKADQEVPALRWADVSGTAAGTKAPAGCTLLNDCKYGHSLEGSTLRITLIRSSYDPDPLPEMGEHVIRLALAPHGGPMTPGQLAALGAAFNHPLAAVNTDIHKGDLPPRASAASCNQPNVTISAVKKCEDEDAVIFRLWETDGQACTAAVTLDRQLLGAAADAVEVDLLERPLKASTAKVAPAGFKVKVPAFGLASVRVRFDKPRRAQRRKQP